MQDSILKYDFSSPLPWEATRQDCVEKPTISSKESSVGTGDILHSNQIYSTCTRIRSLSDMGKDERMAILVSQEDCSCFAQRRAGRFVTQLAT